MFTEHSSSTKVESKIFYWRVNERQNKWQSLTMVFLAKKLLYNSITIGSETGRKSHVFLGNRLGGGGGLGINLPLSLYGIVWLRLAFLYFVYLSFKSQPKRMKKKPLWPSSHSLVLWSCLCKISEEEAHTSPVANGIVAVHIKAKKSIHSIWLWICVKPTIHFLT